jgi:hypothetical protein
LSGTEAAVVGHVDPLFRHGVAALLAGLVDPRRAPEVVQGVFVQQDKDSRPLYLSLLVSMCMESSSRLATRSLA